MFYLTLWQWAGMGPGDVRMGTALGVVAGWTGWPTVVVFIAGAHALMLPFAGWRLTQKRREGLLFGPALVIGAYLAAAVVRFTG